METEYLQAGTGSSTSNGSTPGLRSPVKPMQVVTPTAQRSGAPIPRMIPIDAGQAALVSWDEDWDNEGQQPPARIAAQVPARVEEEEPEPPCRKSRKGKKAYNPRRQLTGDDYFPLHLESREASPEPGAPVRPGQSREEGAFAGAPLRVVKKTSRPSSPSVGKFRCPGEAAWRRYNFLLSRLPPRRGGVLFRDGQPVPVVPAIDPPPYCCFNCWDRNHAVRSCPEPERRDYCANCGRHGVRIEECPRCAEEFKRRERQRQPEDRSGSPPRKLTSRSRRDELEREEECKRRQREELEKAAERRHQEMRREEERRERDERWRAEDERRQREEEQNRRYVEQRKAERRAEEARQEAEALRLEEQRRVENNRLREEAARLLEQREEQALRAELLRQLNERKQSEVQRVAAVRVEEEARRAFEQRRLREQQEELLRTEELRRQIRGAELRTAEELRRIESQRQALEARLLQPVRGVMPEREGRVLGPPRVTHLPAEPAQTRDPVRDALALHAVLRRVYGQPQ
ncbi:inner centromere protein-like [Nasonia vitripennis]|uniref:Uncharacterized protein n=1 Tax=Nasonia vitripennis TaxID=7425 RepID=A0A7M7QDC7_NASVI|nr:inner centromere protein-like [Nasonia vitripennis]